MIVLAIMEKLILENPVGIVSLFVALIAWFRGFKWWVLLPVIVSFCDFWYFQPGIGFIVLVIMAVCGTKTAEKEDSTSKNSKMKVSCPQCGRSLKGATREMVGDRGVCPKCKNEFEIKQEQ